jgi:hypothetical protein
VCIAITTVVVVSKDAETFAPSDRASVTSAPNELKRDKCANSSDCEATTHMDTPGKMTVDVSELIDAGDAKLESETPRSDEGGVESGSKNAEETGGKGRSRKTGAGHRHGRKRRNKEKEEGRFEALEKKKKQLVCAVRSRVSACTYLAELDVAEIFRAVRREIPLWMRSDVFRAIRRKRSSE